jgi:cytochrome c2
MAVGWAALLLVVGSCGGKEEIVDLASANAENGRLLLQQYGCGSCHTIPGVANARGNVGPPLSGIGNRVYLAGVLPNTAENMVRWIREPQRVDPLTAMPDLQVPERHARDMVVYLLKLR